MSRKLYPHPADPETPPGLMFWLGSFIVAVMIVGGTLEMIVSWFVK